MEDNYKCYFSIDKEYFPVVTEGLMDNDREMWTRFYPHETFIKLLKDTIDVLTRKKKASLWVEGAYGTGKSYAVLTLKKMLEASDDEITAYFNKYERAGLTTKLCKEFISAKSGNLLVVSRGFSSDVKSDDDLVFCVQDIINNALEQRGLSAGNDALRTVIINSLRGDKKLFEYVDACLKEDYENLFGGNGVKEVLTKLESYKSGSSELHEIMQKFLIVVREKNIGIFRFGIDDLAQWITDVIKENNLSNIVFIWDEFTDYFNNNIRALSGFQRLVQLSESQPFCFIIVTHNIQNTFDASGKDSDQKRILDRFVQPICRISLPDGMAFSLIKEALKINSTLQDEWNRAKGALIARTKNVREKVKKHIDNLSDEQLEGVLPIQPYTAVFLKHIASNFDSNQRSMFDFITNDDDNVKCFMWYIKHNGLQEVDDDNMCLLTVDALWDYFYEKGRDKIDSKIRNILDNYSVIKVKCGRAGAHKLTINEERVLKTILIMQAVSNYETTSSNVNIDFFTPTFQNILDAYEGTKLNKNDSGAYINTILKPLCDNRIITKRKSGDDFVYGVFNDVIDEPDIEKEKERLRNIFELRTLFNECSIKLEDYIPLRSFLRMRYELELVTRDNLQRTVTNTQDLMDDEYRGWKIKLLVLFAKDSNDASLIRQKIKECVLNPRYYCVFIDATSLTFDGSRLEEYLDHKAYSNCSSNRDSFVSSDEQRKANAVVQKWVQDVSKNAFEIHWGFNNNVSKSAHANNATQIASVLEKIDKERYNAGIETISFNFSDTMWTPYNISQAAEYAINQTFKGAFSGCEQLLESAYKTQPFNEYWKTYPFEIVSQVKIAIDKIITDAFATSERKIGIWQLYSTLIKPPFGFMPCSLSAIMFAFVLREYATGSFRWSDGVSNTTLVASKLKEMVKSVIDRQNNLSARYNETYIITRTEAEKEFDNASATIFSLDIANMSDSVKTQNLIRAKLRTYSFPIFCLKYLSDEKYNGKKDELLRFIDLYIELLGNSSDSLQGDNTIINNIGIACTNNKSLAASFKAILTKDNLVDGMQGYLKTFDDGILITLSNKIGDGGAYIDVLREKFDAASDSMWLWKKETIDDVIKDVIVEYKIIDKSADAVGCNTTYKGTLDAWRDKSRFIKISFDVVNGKVSNALYDLLNFLYKINIEGASFNKEEFLLAVNEGVKEFCDFYDNPIPLFKEVCSHQLLHEISDSQIKLIIESLSTKSFMLSKSEYYNDTQLKIEDLMKKQEATKLRRLWRSLTDEDSPVSWSKKYCMPILCMANSATEDIASLKTALDIVNNVCNGKFVKDSDVKSACLILIDPAQKIFFERLKSEDERRSAFYRYFMKDYGALISDESVVKSKMRERLNSIEYDWYDSLDAQNAVRSIAQNEYNINGYNRALKIINDKGVEAFKSYLEDLVKDNMDIGMAIINGSK